MADSIPHTHSGIALLATKLFAPRWRPDMVSRPRLIEHMQNGIDRTLTLISAPAGSGKTTLLAEWLAGAQARTHRTGWVSLDASDNDASIFWAYVIRGLQRIQPGVGEQALAMVFNPQAPSIQGILTTLINEISLIEERFTLFLDDYHVISDPSIHEGVAYLLDHLPPQMHLVIASRTDPPLPLHRLRARRELTEIRQADLRFTAAEASAFLNDVMGLTLTADAVQVLESRTEGWIAGLQLAALSMQGRDDANGFIAAFAGDDRYIADYLVEEVLRSQPDHLRRFLLHTSILDRLNGPLCEAVSDTGNGHRLLDELERNNLFVVPLDDKRHWYRYHHLFGDMLHTHLLAEFPEQVAGLHRRASRWFENQAFLADAITHALAAKDFERTADLVAKIWPQMNRTYQTSRVLAWLSMLPEDLIHSRPFLCIGYGWGLLEQGNMEQGNVWLLRCKALLDDLPPGKLDEQAFRYLRHHLASAQTYRSLAQGDISSTLAYADEAIAVYPEANYSDHSIPIALKGIAYWTLGNLREARSAFSRVKRIYEDANDVLLTISGAFVLAELSMGQGRLREALDEYLEAIQLLEADGNAVQTGLADLYAGAGKMYLLRGQQEQAEKHIAKSMALGDAASLPGNAYQRYAAAAQLKESQGLLDEALHLFERAEQTYVLSPMPVLRPFSTQKVRIWLKLNRLHDAMEWASAHHPDASGNVEGYMEGYMEEFNQLTLARVRIAQYQAVSDTPLIEEALAILDRLLTAAEAGERTGSIIETLIVHALGCQANGDMPGARASLQRAMELGAPAQHVHVFIIEGEPMVNLLKHAATAGIGGAYARTLLGHTQQTAASQRAGALVAPLTGRETEVLRLIASGMRNQEIADHLFISLSTVKRHIANVYGKMDVTHRTEAIVKGEALGLL